MNKLNTKKMVLTSALAVVMIGSAAAGFAFSSNAKATVADAAIQTTWMGLETGVAYADNVTAFPASYVGVQKEDILAAEDNTMVFGMYASLAAGDWSGMTLRNGLPTNPDYNWPGTANTSLTDYPWSNIIWQNGSGQIHEGREKKSEGYVNEGIRNMPNNWDRKILPVEIHIGTGVDEDISYIKIDGKLLMHEKTDTSVADRITTSMFPDGAHVAIHFNGKGSTNLGILTDLGRVYATEPSILMNEDNNAGDFQKDLTVKVNALDEAAWGEGHTLTVKVNGHELQASQYEVSAVENKAATVTIKKETLNSITDMLDSETYVTYALANGEKSYGAAAVAMSVLFEEPPVLLTDSTMLLENKDAFSVRFTYSGSVDVLADGAVTVKSASTPKMTKTELDASNYTIAKAEGKTDEYVITFKKEYVESIFEKLYTHAFTISFGKNTIDVTAYLNVSTNEFGVRLREGIDYVDGTLVQDKYYTSATIKRFNEANLSSRIFYEKPVDVTKPFTFEYSTLDTSVEWVGLGVMNTPALSDWIYEALGKDAGDILFSIFFGQGRHNMQALQGWAGDLSFEQNTNMRNNLVEIYFGADAEHADDGYMKVNGTLINSSFKVSQADFPEGKAWICLFANNQTTDHDLTVNSSLNAVAVTSPLADSAYQMDLGAAKDFTVELMNTSGKLELSDEYGKIDAANYTFTKGATEGTGTLTIKAAYFSTRIFAQQGKVLIWDTEKETGTGFKMNYSHSGMAVGKVSFLTKGQLKDVEFDLGLSKVDYVLQDDKPVDASKYTVEGGKFTVKAAAIADEVGYQKFIVASAGKLYPCYIYVNTWKDGIATTGASITAKDGTYTVTGEGGFTEAKAYKLSDGISVNFSFTTIGQYFHTGANKDASRVVIKLFDPYTGYTIVITIYANYEDEMLSSSNRALRLQQSILNGDGSQVAGATATSGTGRDVNAPSASGTISVILQENDKGDLVYTIGDREYSITKTGLAGINLDACVLTVSTEGSKATTVTELSAQAGTVAAHTHTFADTWTSDANNHWHAATCDHTEEKKDVAAHTFDDNGKCTVCGYEKEGNKEENKGGGGCGGVAFGLVGGGIALGALAVALVLVTRRKKED